MYLHVLSIALPRGCSERNSAAAAVEMMESGDSVRPVSGLNQVFSTSVDRRYSYPVERPAR